MFPVTAPRLSHLPLPPFQFIIKPDNLEKEIKLQLPIMIASYPYRNSDGTLRRKRGAEYPASLPVFRPWLDMKRKVVT